LFSIHEIMKIVVASSLGEQESGSREHIGGELAGLWEPKLTRGCDSKVVLGWETPCQAPRGPYESSAHSYS
jgi:hypothetical protein